MRSPANWNAWVTALRADSLARRKSARITGDYDSSRWPSARAEDAECCGNHPGATDSLNGAARNWKTPHGFQNTDASGKTAGGGGEFAKQAMAWQTPRGGDRKDELGLARQARMWPTPKTPTGGAETRKSRKSRKSGGEDLAAAAEQWPTPEAHFHKRGPGFAATDSHYKAHDLATAADQWPTPVAGDHRSGVTGKVAKQNARPLCEVASQFSPPARPTSKHGPGCSCSARMLNPRFVELLMNVPILWTDADPLACQDFARWVTASCQWLRALRTLHCETPSTLERRAA